MIGLLYESFHGAIHFHTADVIITRVGKKLPTLSCIFLEEKYEFFPLVSDTSEFFLIAKFCTMRQSTKELRQTVVQVRAFVHL